MPILEPNRHVKLSRLKSRSFFRLDAIDVLMAVMVFGFALRMFIAPAAGFEFDVGTYKGWSYSAVAVGPGQSYTLQLKDSMLPNYPPLSLLILHTTGWIYTKTLSPSFDIDAPVFHTLIKIPAILADLLTALLLALIVSRWKRNQWWGVVAASIYLLHPIPIHDGAFWGQTDAIFALFLVAAFGAFSFDFVFLAGFCMALALLTKLQAAACLPLFIILSLKCGLRRASESFLGACLATIIVLFPFWWEGFIQDAVHIYTSSVGYYSIVSSAAYNFWWTMYADRASDIHDTALLFGLLPYRTIGFMLFGLSTLFPIAMLWRYLKPSPKTATTAPAIFFAASFSAFAFFLWNTQMHERYSFAFVPLGLVVALMSMKSARLYVLISLFLFFNFLGWLPASAFDRMLFSTFPTFDVFIASGLVIFFFLYAGLALHIRREFAHAKKPQWSLRFRFLRMLRKK